MTIFYDYHRGVGFVTENENKYNCFYLAKYSNDIVQYETEKVILEEWYEDMKGLPLGKVMFLKGSIRDDFEECGEQNQNFTMVRVINHLETATRLGYAFLEVSDSVFSDIAKEISLPEGGGLTIYFPDREFAYTTDEKFVFGKDELTDLNNVSGEIVKIREEKYYAFSMKEEKYGFLICYLLPQHAILKQAYNNSIVIICIWVCAVLISFFIYTQLSNQVSISTKKIISYINKYRFGDKKVRKQVLSNMPINEFDDIAKALVEMTGRITDLVQKEYIVKMNQQMAEYKAMQAEINPHFFSNVMNSLLALNRIGDTKKLEFGIINFSRMFRYTCEHDYESTVLQECDFIENYLMLEKVRFEERLNYQIHVEESLEDFPIPKLLLQPIIENAMHHGMPQDGSSLTIMVNVSSVDGRDGKNFVWIAVANDGTPYIKEEILGNGRVGITNVRERLNIIYPNSFFWYDRKGHFQTICNILIYKK